ncbi:MAG: alpha/beta fold hydrolase [Lautropia mirabilis]
MDGPALPAHDLSLARRHEAEATALAERAVVLASRAAREAVHASVQGTGASPVVENLTLPTPFGALHMRRWLPAGAATGHGAGAGAGAGMGAANGTGAGAGTASAAGIAGAAGAAGAAGVGPGALLFAGDHRPRVVLLHGMFGDVDVWSATALNLARGGQEVLAFDLPGHGQSEAEVANADEAVQALLAALQAHDGQMGMERPVLLVGHSFGGLVASMLAARMADAASPALAGLVLLSPSGLGEEVNRDFLLSVIEAADDGALARALEALTVKHYRSSAAYVRAMRARLQAAQAQLYRLVDDVVDITGRQSRSIVETLASLSVPVTLVHGREDAVIPWQHALNAPPATALHLLPGIGHMPHWEAAALTTNIIIRAAAEAAGLRSAG